MGIQSIIFKTACGAINKYNDLKGIEPLEPKKVARLSKHVPHKYTYDRQLKLPFEAQTRWGENIPGMNDKTGFKVIEGESDEDRQKRNYSGFYGYDTLHGACSSAWHGTVTSSVAGPITRTSIP